MVAGVLVVKINRVSRLDGAVGPARGRGHHFYVVTIAVIAAATVVQTLGILHLEHDARVRARDQREETEIKVASCGCNGR